MTDFPPLAERISKATSRPCRVHPDALARRAAILRPADQTSHLSRRTCVTLRAQPACSPSPALPDCATRFKQLIWGGLIYG
jgi:hypothetical protein